MDIVRFKGGLGNQMFQYAFVEALRRRGRKVGCNLGFYRIHNSVMPFVLDKVFENVDLQEVDDEIFDAVDSEWKKIKQDSDLLNKFKRNIKRRFFYVEEGSCIYDENVFKTVNCTFVGYWQTYKYFVEIKEHILHSFEFNIKDHKLKSLAEKLKPNYYGVHIRRKDYLHIDAHNICGLKYYVEAIQYVKAGQADAKFIFFSDDISWVKENFCFEDMIICEENLYTDYQDWYDMYLMTQCAGNIISNSTFGWWGAWLNQNNGIVIAPKQWIKGMRTPDIWCEDWIKL